MGFFAYPPEKVYFKLDSQGNVEGSSTANRGEVLLERK
jgi:hypothetical protein